jgi:putative salt-induced outer membrane protein YdiY
MVRRFLLSCSTMLALTVTAQVANAQAGADIGQLSSLPKPSAAPAACPAPPKDPAIWDKSLIFGLNYTDGNTKTTNINLGGRASRDYENNAWNFQSDFNYGSAAESADEARRENKNNIRTTGDYRRVLNDTWFAGAGTAFAHDEIADLKYRVIVSPSAGRYLVRDEETKLSLEAGPSYVWDKLGDDSENFVAARIADRWEWKISETAKIFQAAEYLVSVEDSGQYIVNAELGLETAINSYMSLVLSVKDYYINQPAEDRVPNDVLTLTALKVAL